MSENVVVVRERRGLGALRSLFACLRADAVVWAGEGPAPSMYVELARARNIPLAMLWTARTLETLRGKPQGIEALKPQPIVHASRAAEVVDALRSLGFKPVFLLSAPGEAFPAEAFDTSPRPDRKSRRKHVAISGFDTFTSAITQYVTDFLPEWEPHLLRFDTRADLVTSLLVMLRCDVWYSVGGPPSERWLARAARFFRKRRVVHWVGVDVELVESGKEAITTSFAPRMHHVAETDWMAKPLNELGLRTSLASVPPRYVAQEIPPLPERFTVLIYAPRTRGEFYGKAAFERLFVQLQSLNIRYLIVGGGELKIPAGVDAVNLGWQHSMQPLYPKTTMLIRLRNERDGLSLMVMEALSYGRYVVWTQAFPHVSVPESFDEVPEIVRACYEQHERGELTVQRDAADMIAREYSIVPATLRLGNIWDDALASP